MLVISFIIIAVLTAADQAIKLAVIQNFDECTSVLKRYYTFSIGDFKVFSLTHIRNDGAGWSILGGQTIFLVAFTTIVMIGIIAYMMIKRKSMKKVEFFCLSLIVAGGIGNLIDRIRMLFDAEFSGVVDYIVFDFITFPVFNFADICVVLGGIGICAYYIIDELKNSKLKKERAKPSSSNEQI